jgi:hypothetical protein
MFNLHVITFQKNDLSAHCNLIAVTGNKGSNLGLPLLFQSTDLQCFKGSVPCSLNEGMTLQYL